jgi:hypothetical protein
MTNPLGSSSETTAAGKVNPASLQLGKLDRLVAGLAQSQQQPLLLGVSGRHRRIAPSSRIIRTGSTAAAAT